ncbi:MAG: polymerase sigma-B factor, partial [Acidimicrobiaceae bacterium]|nr:polymerase sigma-B factor [Acidimicrobiaceae bacterium]
MASAVMAPARRQRLRQVLEEYSVTRDGALRDELVQSYYGLASNLASRFSGRGEELDDLTQVALLGLVRAIDRFDPDRGVELTTVATATNLGDLKRHF